MPTFFIEFHVRFTKGWNRIFPERKQARRSRNVAEFTEKNPDRKTTSENHGKIPNARNQHFPKENQHHERSIFGVQRLYEIFYIKIAVLYYQLGFQRI